MKKNKTNRTDDTVVSSCLIITIGVIYWIPLILLVINVVRLSIIFAGLYTIINIMFWNNMFKGEPRKIVLGSSIMEIALILPMLIVLFIKVLF